MKRFLIIVLSLFCLTPVCRAENATITLTVWMRSGPGVEYETVSTVKTGETVEVIGQEKGWTRVRSKEGGQGWISARYLTPRTSGDPSPDMAAEPRNPAALESETLRLQSVIAEKDEKINEIQQQYEKLKTDASGYIEVQKKLDTALAGLSRTKDECRRLEKTIDDLQKDRILKGALIGAGILLLGILMGLNFKKQRHRSSLL